jgi:putative component of toxin-antitoxin plasmid stabilization module
LKDRKAKAKILVRIQRIEYDGHLVLLLIGGDKSTQSKDVEKAKLLWKDYQKNRK